MKIVVKQTDELKSSKLHLGFKKIIEEFFVYLTDDSGTPLSCEIVYGKAAKNDMVHRLLVEHFVPVDWTNNKERFDTENIVEEVSYEEYMNIANNELENIEE